MSSTPISRSFSRVKQAWYAQPPLDDGLYANEEILISLSVEDGVSGEFAVRWHDIGANPAPRLEVFDDGWGLLPYFEDLLKEMATLHDRTPSADDFCAMLSRLGIEDATPRKDPEHLAGVLRARRKEMGRP